MVEQNRRTSSHTQEMSTVSLSDYIRDFNRTFFTTVFGKPAVKEVVKPLAMIGIQEPTELSFDFLLESDDAVYSFYYKAHGKENKHLSLVKNPKYRGSQFELYDFDASLSAKVDNEPEPVFIYINNTDDLAFLHNHDAIEPAINLHQEIVNSNIKRVRAHGI